MSTSKKNSAGFKLQGEIDLQGMHIMVENRKGSVRRGVAEDGTPWETKMKYPYGYISKTKAADDEHVDCYVGDNRESDKVFVIHQVDPDTKKYDEDKVMLGFSNAKEAKAVYLDHYDSPDFFGSLTEMSVERFKESLKENHGKKLKKSFMENPDVINALEILGLGEFEKGKKVPVGTVSGKYKKVAEGKWALNADSESSPKENYSPTDFKEVVTSGKLKVSRNEQLMDLFEKNAGAKAYIMHDGKYKLGSIDWDKTSSLDDVTVKFTDGTSGSWDGFSTKKIYRVLKQKKSEPLKKGEDEFEKGKKVPVGTISGDYKKVAEGKWEPVKKDGGLNHLANTTFKHRGEMHRIKKVEKIKSGDHHITTTENKTFSHAKLADQGVKFAQKPEKEKSEPKVLTSAEMKAKNAGKIKELNRERNQLLMDMEQEAEPEGGPIANRYGRQLDSLDKKIHALSYGKNAKPMTYDEVFKKGEDELEMDEISKAHEILGLGEFSKAIEVGHINKYGKQKQSDGTWKYVGLPGGPAAPAAPAADPNAEPGATDHTHILKDVETVARNTHTPSQKMKELVDLGLKDVGKISDISGMDRSDVARHFIQNNLTHEPSNIKAEDYKGLLPKVPVKKRWSSYRVMLNMVAKGMGKSLIAYGTGGVGKTYNMKQVFEGHSLKEFQEGMLPGFGDYDYVKITGKSTPTAMYKSLYEHNGKTVVFDDCDSVLNDETSINILKGALDTTGDGTITYGSGMKIKDSNGEPIPQRFSFVGRAVFISNLEAKQMPQPLRSRSFTVDLTMTPDETITMLKDIVQVMPFQNNRGEAIQVSAEDRTAAINFLEKYKNQVNVDHLNARTLGSIALVKKQIDATPDSGVTWEEVAITMLS